MQPADHSQTPFTVISWVLMFINTLPISPNHPISVERHNHLFAIPQTFARPVCKDLPPLKKKNHTAANIAVKNHNSMLMRSIHTAFFILFIPPLPSGCSWIYIFPKIPKTAAQRILSPSISLHLSSLDKHLTKKLTIKPNPTQTQSTRAPSGSYTPAP